MSSCCRPEEPSTDKCAPKHSINWMLWSCFVIAFAAVALHLWSPAWMDEFPHLKGFSHSMADLLGRMWWGIGIGMIAIGILSQVPRGWIVGLMGEGLFRAIGLGLFFDLCSHGILMVAAKLYERGATIGQTLAFLIASPWNSISFTFILVGLIGWKWTLNFIVLSAVIALGTGLIADWLVKKGLLPKNVNRKALPEGFSVKTEIKQHLKAIRWRFSLIPLILKSGFHDSLTLVRWLLLGVIVASLLKVWVPDDVFALWFGATWTGLGLTMVATTLIEVCSEGSSPIAADLMNRAHAPGNAFTFLMGGVATDYTELMVIRETTQSWKLALILPLATVPQVLIIGALLNYLYQS